MFISGPEPSASFTVLWMDLQPGAAKEHRKCTIYIVNRKLILGKWGPAGAQIQEEKEKRFCWHFCQLHASSGCFYSRSIPVPHRHFKTLLA